MSELRVRNDFNYVVFLFVLQGDEELRVTGALSLRTHGKVHRIAKTDTSVSFCNSLAILKPLSETGLLAYIVPDDDASL